ncbi:hypothetical protein [Lactococcus lactis]
MLEARHAKNKQEQIKIQNLNALKQGGSQSMEFMNRNFGFTHLDMKKLDVSVDSDKLEKVSKITMLIFIEKSSLMAEVSFISRFYQVLTILLKIYSRVLKKRRKILKKLLRLIRNDQSKRTEKGRVEDKKKSEPKFLPHQFLKKLG